jgi:hypothetical protein
MSSIKRYLTDTLKQNENVAIEMESKLSRHLDILPELEEWIATGGFRQTNPIRVSGYSAEDISKLAPFMNGVGVYNFLVTLRERPEIGLEIIGRGFAHCRMDF